MTIIHINGNEFDPEIDQDILRNEGILPGDIAGTKYILVQTRNPLTKEENQELNQRGAEILEYVSPCTYLCYYDAGELTPVLDLEPVAWASQYLRAFKVPPYLKSTITETSIITERHPTSESLEPTVEIQAPTHLYGRSTVQTRLPGDRCEHLATRTFMPTFRSRIKRKIDIVLHNGIEVDSDFLAAVATAAHVDRDVVENAKHKVRVFMEERYLDSVASLDTVYFIEEVARPRLWNDQARIILNASHPISASTLRPLRGRGQVIAVADSGFDTGDMNNYHPAFANRLLALYPLGRTENADDPDGHGTHVCGSILGDGLHAGGLQIQGTAPEAGLVVQSLFSEFSSEGRSILGGIHKRLYNLFDLPYRLHGARIHNNSWGDRCWPNTDGYTDSSRQVDDYAYTHPDMVILFAAGNDCRYDHEYGHICSYAFAKNCITVGASENVRLNSTVKWESVSEEFPNAPVHGDLVADNQEGMAATSSRGHPIPWGKRVRIKPDVVAPGTAILSTRSQNATNESQIMRNVNRWGIAPDNGWLYLGGTSMATGLVSGCCAILREHVTMEINKPDYSPCSSLIKALLINGAIDLAGQYPVSEAGRSPNPSSGWGRVSLQNSLIANAGPDYGWTEEILYEGATFTTQIGVTKPSHIECCLKATLVWVDPPSPPGANGSQVLQNELGLAVLITGREKHGNREEGDPDFDKCNNVQQVVWDGLRGVRSITLEVRSLHYRLKGSQQFAVVWNVMECT